MKFTLILAAITIALPTTTVENAKETSRMNDQDAGFISTDAKSFDQGLNNMNFKSPKIVSFDEDDNNDMEIEIPETLLTNTDSDSFRGRLDDMDVDTGSFDADSFSSDDDSIRQLDSFNFDEDLNDFDAKMLNSDLRQLTDDKMKLSPPKRVTFDKDVVFENSHNVLRKAKQNAGIERLSNNAGPVNPQLEEMPLYYDDLENAVLRSIILDDENGRLFNTEDLEADNVLKGRTSSSSQH